MKKKIISFLLCFVILIAILVPTIASSAENTCTEHDFTAEVKSEKYLAFAGTCRSEAIYHKSCSVCGESSKGYTNASTFNGEKDPDNHVGGQRIDGRVEADHRKQIDGQTGNTICLGCNQVKISSTAIPANNHAALDTDPYQSDNNNHWKICTFPVGNETCGVRFNIVAHSSTGENVANCKHKAICDVCGVEYGSVYGSHIESPGWRSNETHHWHYCLECNGDLDRTEAKHVFDQKNTNKMYKYCNAGCTTAAVYYYSCVCGAKGTETFEYGEPDGHKPNTEWICDENDHWHTCIYCDTEIDRSREAHEFDLKNTDVKHLATEGTCTESATYFYSCICGKNSTETFEEGLPLGHALTHVSKKDATVDAAGNIEYWYCKHCDKYFSDENGTKEITKTETVIEKLAAESVAKTKDGNSLMMWLSLLSVSGTAMIATTYACEKKKK